MRRILLAPSAALGLAVLLTGAPLANQPIPPGLDLLETDPATTYQDLDLAPGTLLPFCNNAPFSGRVYFQGSPIDCFGTVCGLSPADTIVARQAQADPPLDTIPIEIVALELRSVAPIIVDCPPGSPQTWNVSASVPEGDPNQTPGSMTIDQSYLHGGTFTSTLPVRPQMTFTRVPDGATVGPTLAPGPIVFDVSAPTDWCHRGNPLDDPEGDYVHRYNSGTNFFPGILCPSSPGGGGQRRKRLTGEQAILAAHGILPGEKKHHYKCFHIAGPPLNRTVGLQDQFGSQSVQVLEPLYLCPPTIKNNQFGSLHSPHLKCYNIQPQFDPPATVDLKTQFGLERYVNVGPARMLCTPASKQVVNPPPVGPPLTAPPLSPHYTCYQITGPAPTPPRVVNLQTQFGNEPNVPVGPPRFLCAPTIKTAPPNPPHGSLQEPHLKCYQIPGSNPPHVVNLRTQFSPPDEMNVPVDVADLLCIPAKKTPHECANVRFPNKVQLGWDPVVLPNVRYNVYRADVPSFPSNYGSCLAQSLPSPSVMDMATPSPPGRAFYYLSTATIPGQDGPIEGTLGFTSAGAERPNIQSCAP